MIQDYSCVFDGKQQVKIRAVSFRDHRVLRKVSGAVLTCTLLIGLISCLIFGVLIQSGLKDLEAKQTVKLKLIKEQQTLYAQRSALLDRSRIELVAANLGLYSPQKKQVHHL